jgi:hypothetical protein
MRRELGSAYSSDPEVPPFSDQQNGQFLFVSNDMEGPDRVVEAHPSADEERNFFRALEDDDGRVRLFHPSTSTFLFVSNDMAGPDRIVEAHPSADEERNRFEVNRLEDGSFAFFNTSTKTFLFLSNDRRGNDFVIEAHNSIELRNRFRVKV